MFKFESIAYLWKNFSEPLLDTCLHKISQQEDSLPMQGQRSSVDPFPETLEIDHRSTSSTANMDQENFWNSMLLHPAEAQNLLDCRLSPIDRNMLSTNITTEGSSSSSIWSSNGPSSSENSRNQGRQEDTKMAEDSSSIWSSNGPSSVSPLSVGPIDVENLLSLEDVDINLNSTEDDGQSFSFSQSSHMNNVPEDLDHSAALVTIGGEPSESRVSSHPYIPNLLKRECCPSSSNSHASSSGVVGFKRKNIEGFPGQSSARGSANLFYTGEDNPVVSVSNNASSGINVSSPSNNISASSSSSEQLNPRFSTIIRGNAENSRRNFRLRFNPARQIDIYPPDFYSSRDTIQNSSIWIPNEPLSHPIPFNQREESRSASTPSLQQQPHIPVIPVLPRNANIHTRIVSLLNSVNSSETLRAIREETISRNLPRNNLLEQSLIGPRNEVRNLVQDSANWNVTNGGAATVVTPNSRAGSSSGVHPLVEPTWVPNRNSSTRLCRSSAEAVQRTSLTSGSGSESGGQGSNILSHRSSHSATSQEAGLTSGSLSHGNQQSLLRSALLMDRQNDGGPSSLRSLAAREGRNRMILEIRNALDLMRRGGNLQIEDVFMLDHPVFHGVADLHDRHREMRLDVDNMSYEELLALEERIGNVSTGLGEETILKCLQKRKHSLVSIRAMAEPEPCCICQEEYVEGEDLGTLDCGHDFHTACIEQWLMQKNLCPICKTTALKT